MATWHDIQVTAEQAGTAGRRTDATARAVIECAADAIVAFSTDRNVMLWNPVTKKGDRVGFRTLADGRKVRFFKSNKEVVDA